MEIEIVPISSDSEEFQCAILRIGSVKILLDCGWTESLDVSRYEALPEHLFSEIDLVLLSHYSLAHCGALPYLLFRGAGKKKFSKRVVATEAVKRMGELTLASLHEDIDKVKQVSVSDESYTMSVEDIVCAFSSIEAVQYNETFYVEKKNCEDKKKISITAHPAGRLLGGAYFVITVGSEQIVYAVDYALVGGKAVGGMVPSAAKNASILITDSAKSVEEAAAKKPQETLISSIKHALRNGGTVLMPVDPNGAVLDLLLLIESAFRADASLLVYPVVFLSPLGDVVLDQVKTRMEWMNKQVLTEFEESVNFAAHPFLLNHVEICSDFMEYNEKFGLNRRPKLVLSTCASLDFGDSRELLSKLGPDPANLVILTQQPIFGLAKKILTNTGLEVKENQFVKSSFPDEQLRQIYRECLEKEAQDDELRRRRQREKMMGAQQAAAPSSATAVPVDLIRGGGLDLEGPDTAGGLFFRPQLFAAQTVASSAVIKTHRVASDYGEELNSLEVDTWRAHAEMGDLGSAREAAILAAQQQLKSEKIKGEQPLIKHDAETGVKNELTAGGVVGESFDWRRDLQVRFGEPQRVELRERTFRIACKVKFIPLAGTAPVHRREFIATANPRSLVMLPTKNLQDLNLVALMLKERGAQFFPTQEDLHGGAADDTVIVAPAMVTISGKKKWIHIDPSLLRELEFKNVPLSKVKVAKLDRTGSLLKMHPREDLIKVPCGDFIDFAVVETEKNSKKIKPDSSLLVNSTPFRLGQFARSVAQQLPESKVEFVTTECGRALSVSLPKGGGELVIALSRQSASACPLVEVLGAPSPCFYKVRQILYASNLLL